MPTSALTSLGQDRDAAPAREPDLGPDLQASATALANGLTVVLIPDHRVPVATHMLWYRVGSADEEPGKSGLAHFFEHLMFKGTRDNPGDSYARAIGRVGGELNAFTSYDFTAYYATVGTEHLERVMALEADRMVNLDLSAEQLAVERNVVIEERRMRTDSNPEALLYEQLMAVRYVNHRYGAPVIGWLHEIHGWTCDDALTFYRRWYAPNNAILVVAGDVAMDRLTPLAERHYGALQPAATIGRRRTVEPDAIAERRVVMIDRRAGRALWLRLHLAPAYGKPDRSRTVVVETLAEILGGGPASLLHRRLVQDLNLAADVGVEYAPAAVDPTPFAIAAVPAPGVALDKLEQALEDALAAACDGEIAEADVARARRALSAATVRSFDGTYRAALAAGSALATGVPLDEIGTRRRRIAGVTRDQVRDEARALLRRATAATGSLAPR